MKNFFKNSLFLFVVVVAVFLVGVIFDTIFPQGITWPENSEPISGAHISGTALSLIFALYLYRLAYKVSILRRYINATFVATALVGISFLAFRYWSFSQATKDQLIGIIFIFTFLFMFLPSYRNYIFIVFAALVAIVFIDESSIALKIPSYGVYGALVLACLGFIIYSLSVDPKKMCQHCNSTKLIYKTGKETDYFWIYSNKDGSADMRRKNNYEVANFVSEWKCEKCQKDTKFKHVQSRNPSKANRIELVL